MTERIVREYFTGLWAGDDSVVRKYLAPDYRMVGGDKRVRARSWSGVLITKGGYARAFPDLKVRIDDVVVAGSRAVVQWSASGTHRGPLHGVAATGRRAVFHGMSTFTLRGRQIIEERYVYDSLDLYQQLGDVPRARGNHR